MIRVKRGPCPPELGPGSKGAAETAAAAAFYANPAHRGKPFPFKQYKHEKVVEALEALFAGKCAYCETPYDAAGPLDVEHFRPKGEVADADGAPTAPGYYWLAAEWTNLYPSCIDCNRQRRHRIPVAGGGGARQKQRRGKAILFPLEDPGKRAHDAAELARERPLLLEPCGTAPADDPERHLEFIEEGLVRPRSTHPGKGRKAEVSIRVYGLDREGLVRRRRDRMTLVEGDLALFADMARELERRPGDAAVRRWLEAIVARLKAYQRPDAPYSAAARQRIARFLDAEKLEL